MRTCTLGQGMHSGATRCSYTRAPGWWDMHGCMQSAWVCMGAVYMHGCMVAMYAWAATRAMHTCGV